jgi:hypothetical protein
VHHGPDDVGSAEGVGRGTETKAQSAAGRPSDQARAQSARSRYASITDGLQVATWNSGFKLSLRFASAAENAKSEPDLTTEGARVSLKGSQLPVRVLLMNLTCLGPFSRAVGASVREPSDRLKTRWSILCTCRAATCGARLLGSVRRSPTRSASRDRDDERRGHRQVLPIILKIKRREWLQLFFS